MKALVTAALILCAGAAQAEAVVRGSGAVLRVLDKVTGQTIDLDMANGGAAPMGRLQVELGECRYPEGNPSGDAYAFVTVRDDAAVAIFSGWMIASTPALNALEHPRYDVWVIRCKTG